LRQPAFGEGGDIDVVERADHDVGAGGGKQRHAFWCGESASTSSTSKIATRNIGYALLSAIGQ
jgi:hypothetical protein